ncbi:hypothetical protein GC207_13385 [bacterium]|nr:hypothetical protein [bacterium]
MKNPHTRREFLADVSRGTLVAAVGLDLATDLKLAQAAPETADALTFGSLEPLVELMQETPVDQLLPILSAKLQSGTELKQLVAAAAVANARTFGGEDYVGFHTMMALAPAFHIAGEMPSAEQALPIFKVLYRNTNRINETGGRKNEVLHPVLPIVSTGGDANDEAMRQAVHDRNATQAERVFAGLGEGAPDEALNHLLHVVQEATEVHRVVLPYRAWDLLGMIGMEQARTLLRQSVRYCVKMESWASDPRRSTPRTLLPRLLEEHRLLDRSAGKRSLDDGAFEALSQTFFKSTDEQAAEAAAAALADGIDPATVGEAITLAANQLVLRDMGRRPQDEVTGKPIGSVHGDSIGVHACDSANAWRNLSRISNQRNGFASLILGAYQVAHDRTDRGGDFLNWQPLPYGWQFEQTKNMTDAEAVLRDADEAVRGNLQARASALVHRYGELGGSPDKVFALLRRYAVSEDGALHAEKFYRTVSEEFRSTREAFRWRHLVALARVTASEYGRPAPGMAQARELLKV